MLGHVCQLHYYGGGVVAYHSENGKLARLQFHRGPCLKIGQAVTFSIVDGVAVDILTSDPSKEAVLKHARGAVSAHTLVSGRMMFRGQPRRKLVPCPNPCATNACRRRWGASAMPLQRSNWNGRTKLKRNCNDYWRMAMAWMVTGCAAWFVAWQPGWIGRWCEGYSARSKIFGAEGRCQTGFLPAAEANSPCADHRPAKHWPRGRQHAEMSWEPPGLYPGIVWSSWLCCLASHFSDAAVASASLADCGSDGAKVGQHDKKTSVANRLPAADSSGVSNSVFYPNKKVQGLPTVFEGEDVIQLQCGLCSATISSSWFFRHPGTQQISVLVPQHGHLACGKKLGKLSPWIPASDVTPKPAKLEILTLCPHNRELRNCTLCGGSRICEHQKRRDRCATCRCLPRPLKMARAEHQDSASKNIWLNHIKPIYIIYLNHPEAV